MPFISVIEFIELCKYLKEHPVVQAEMVEVKQQPGLPPPPTPPDAKGVETIHETTSPKSVAELADMLNGL